ncbi:MAG: 2OG-Fe(II) oxygenase [Pseudomonadota bacterium]
MTSERAEAVATNFKLALQNATWSDDPYKHCIIRDVLPDNVCENLASAEFPTQVLNGVSGSREAHNDSRRYFNEATMIAGGVFDDVATAFQKEETAQAIARSFGADIEGCLLRIEFAQDTDGFWLRPHTDLGVKKFTMLLYLSDGPDHDMMGTDIYKDEDTWSKRTPFAPNIALAFKPNDRTWHGFEKRPIIGVRKSIIINYVTTEWRDRDQLAFADTPIRIN